MLFAPFSPVRVEWRYVTLDLVGGCEWAPHVTPVLPLITCDYGSHLGQVCCPVAAVGQGVQQTIT